jgi:hypothetical protein
MVFNSEFVPDYLRSETEQLITSTRKNLILFFYFLCFQLIFDISYGFNSIQNRNNIYIELSRFYGAIGRKIIYKISLKKTIFKPFNKNKNMKKL